MGKTEQIIFFEYYIMHKVYKKKIKEAQLSCKSYTCIYTEKIG